jgi:hypothetical protein
MLTAERNQVAHRIARPTVELGPARALLRVHHLRLLQRAAVRKIDGDPGRPLVHRGVQMIHHSGALVCLEPRNSVVQVHGVMNLLSAPVH